MDPKWFPGAERPFQAGGPGIIAAGIINTTTMLLPPGQFRQFLAVPSLLGILYYQRHHTTGRTEQDYLTAINISLLLARLVDACVLHDAEHDFHRVDASGKARETAEEIEKMTLWQKLRWNLDLFTTMRGIGWNWRVKNVDEVRADISRRFSAP